MRDGLPSRGPLRSAPRSARIVRRCRSIGRDDQLPPGVALRVAGQQVEQGRGVVADVLVGGEQAEVGVEQRRGLVVVAGAQVDVAAQRLAPPAARPATACSASSGPGSRTRRARRSVPSAAPSRRCRASSKRAFSSTSAVTCLPFSAACISARVIGESPLVRYSVCLMASTLGSLAALADELDHRIERVERMVQQDVALGEWRRTGPRRARDRSPRGGCGVNGGSRRWSRPGTAVSSIMAGQIQRAGNAIDLAVRLGRRRRRFAQRFFRLDDLAHQLFVGAGGHFQPHGVAALPGLEALFDQPQHVVRLLLQQLDVAVARDAERRPVQDVEAAEQLAAAGPTRRLPAG